MHNHDCTQGSSCVIHRKAFIFDSVLHDGIQVFVCCLFLFDGSVRAGAISGGR